MAGPVTAYSAEQSIRFFNICQDTNKYRIMSFDVFVCHGYSGTKTCRRYIGEKQEQKQEGYNMSNCPIDLCIKFQQRRLVFAGINDKKFERLGSGHSIAKNWLFHPVFGEKDFLLP
jgi:hypothetical protein